MDIIKNNFWSNFNWKVFSLWSLYWFAATLIAAIFIDRPFVNEIKPDHFAVVALIKRAIFSMISAFFFTIWIPWKKKKTVDQQP